MKVVWSRRAIRNLESLRDYIEQSSEQNAAGIARRILQAVDLLQNHPAIGRPGRVMGTRELVIPNTPYIVAYRIKRERLELVAVLHGHERWPSRF
jgi:addiction module RelE/StbE family toxin